MDGWALTPRSSIVNTDGANRPGNPVHGSANGTRQPPCRRLNTGRARSPQQQTACCRLTIKGVGTITNGAMEAMEAATSVKGSLPSGETERSTQSLNDLFKQYKPPSSMHEQRKQLAYSPPAFRPPHRDRESERNTNVRTIESKKGILDSKIIGKSRNTWAEQERPLAGGMRSKPAGIPAVLEQ